MKLSKNKALLLKILTIWEAPDLGYYIVTKKQDIV